MKNQDNNIYSQNLALENIKYFISYLNKTLCTGSVTLQWMRSYKKFGAEFSLSQECTELLIEVLKSSPQFFKKLDFSYQAFSNYHANIIFQLLSNNSRLQYLSLDLNKQKLNEISLESLIHLISNSTIEEIGLELPIIDGQIIKIFEALSVSRKLQSLILLSNEIEKLTPYICRITSLKKLDLSDNKLDFNATTALVHLLKNMTNLQSIDISGCDLNYNIIKKLTPLIGEIVHLKSFYIDDCDLDSEKIIAFTPFIRQMSNLRELNISYNKLNFEAIGALTPSISKMINLRSLDISQCYLDHNSIKILTSSISTVTNLEKLNLSFNNSKTKTIELFAPLLNIMINLQSLNLYYNHLNSATIETFLPALSKMTNLKSLNLSSNDLDYVAIKELAPYLSKMTSLQNFNLSDNPLDDRAIEILAPSIGKMSSLKNLSLSCHTFNNDTFEKLSSYLYNLTSLVKLSIKSQHLPLAQSASLIELFLYNDTITLLEIYIGNFPQVTDSINKMVNKNFSLTYLELRECKKGGPSKLLEHMIIRNQLIQDEAKDIAESLNINYEQKYNHLDTMTINSDIMLEIFLNLNCTRKLKFLQYTQLTSKPALINLFQKEGKNGSLWLSRLEDMVSAKFFYLIGVCKNFIVYKEANDSKEIYENRLYIPELIIKYVASFVGKKNLSVDMIMKTPQTNCEDKHTALVEEISDYQGASLALIDEFTPNNLNLNEVEQNLIGI